MFSRIAAALALLSAVLMPLVAPTSVSANTNDDAQEHLDNLAAIVVEDHNEARRAAGLNELSWHPGLAEFTNTNSELMANTGQLTQTDLNKVMDTHLGAQWAGENTAVMFDGATKATEIWLGSKPHAETLMAPFATHIFASVRCSADGRLWATVMVLEDRTAAAVAPPAATDRTNSGARCARPFEPFRSSPDFVAQQYRDFLGREPEQTGIDYWVIEIENGRVEPVALINAFMNSPEFAGRIAPVVRGHMAATGGLPTASDLKASLVAADGGESRAALTERVLLSPAGLSAYDGLDGEAFVHQMHRLLLNRAATSDELALWNAKLTDNSIATKASVLTEFSGTEEYHKKTYAALEVYMAYTAMLNRVPDNTGLKYWTGVIDGGGSIEALLHSFMMSDEYRNRF